MKFGKEQSDDKKLERHSPPRHGSDDQLAGCQRIRLRADRQILSSIRQFKKDRLIIELFMGEQNRD
jgi:hypothetical protein